MYMWLLPFRYWQDFCFLPIVAAGIFLFRADGFAATLYAVVTVEILQLSFGIMNAILGILYVGVFWQAANAFLGCACFERSGVITVHVLLLACISVFFVSGDGERGIFPHAAAANVAAVPL